MKAGEWKEKGRGIPCLCYSLTLVPALQAMMYKSDMPLQMYIFYL